MPTYRVYYTERDPVTAVDTSRYTSPSERLHGLGGAGRAIDETEWEEEVEAGDRAGALEDLLRGPRWRAVRRHVGRR